MATGSVGSRPRPGPTLYHLADVRLGGAFPFLGQDGAAHRRQVRETFERAVDQGFNLAPSVVLITGNLFGTQFPSRDLTDFARAQIARFSSRNIPVLIAAGPLDALYEKHYVAGALSDLERVSVFPTSPKIIDLPELDLSVIGASWGGTPLQSDFLSAIASNRSHQFTVGAAYFDLPEGGNGVRTLRRQIASSGASYLALGGSTARRDLSVDKVPAWCPGAPELVTADPGEGSPLLVQLGSPTPAVTPKPVAKRRYARFTIDPGSHASPEDLANAIRAVADPNLVAVVHLTGTSHINQFIDINELRGRLSREFLSLEILDESNPALEGLTASPYPELSVAGKLIGVARAEIERATTDEARRRAGAALRLGLALLEGRRPA